MKVKLEKYNPNWKSLFEIEKKKILNALNCEKIEINILAVHLSLIFVQNQQLI